MGAAWQRAPSSIATFGSEKKPRKAEPCMNENPRFEPYDPHKAADPSEPIDPPAGMPPLADPHGFGWNLSRSPEPTGMVAAIPISIPSPLGMLAPREVPGYRQAVEAGIVRLPPADEPPIPLPGISGAWRTTITMWGPLVVFAVAMGVFASAGIMIWLLGVYAAILAAFPWARRWCEQRNLEELAAGYITMPVMRRYTARSSAQLGLPAWNYAGTWAFTRRGVIKWAPDPSVDAPGFYPSQNHPERLQLWSGSEWLPKYRELPAPTS